jgi:AcrR family transcriptional regulator
MSATSTPADPGRTRQPRMPIEVRREQVLDVALKLIVEKGYAAATMEAVAREADLAKPRVYSAYPGRGPLLRALLEPPWPRRCRRSPRTPTSPRP